MKTPTIILLSNIIAINCIFSQANNNQIQLIDYKVNGNQVPLDYICDTCVLSTETQSDLFIINILTPCNEYAEEFYARKSKDTLLLSNGIKLDIIDTVIKFNELTNKMDTIFTATSTISQCCSSHSQCIYTYTIKGLIDKPNFIKYNNYLLKKCILKKETYTINNGDTLNYTDRFGLKQGMWIEYYSDGNIKSKDDYINGVIKRGYEFNNKGDTLIIRMHYDQDIEIHYYK